MSVSPTFGAQCGDFIVFAFSRFRTDLFAANHYGLAGDLTRSLTDVFWTALQFANTAVRSGGGDV
jgi:hypothetical protein